MAKRAIIATSNPWLPSRLSGLFDAEVIEVSTVVEFERGGNLARAGDMVLIDVPMCFSAQEDPSICASLFLARLGQSVCARVCLLIPEHIADRDPALIRLCHEYHYLFVQLCGDQSEDTLRIGQKGKELLPLEQPIIDVHWDYEFCEGGDEFVYSG